MDHAKLINSELKCLNLWLKSKKSSINADKTKYLLLSYDKNLNFPIVRIGNNKIKETCLAKFLGIDLDKIKCK